MEDSKWVDINDFSKLKRLSISTVRRYIKANRINWKKEAGKYLIEVKAMLLDMNVDFEQERELLRYKLENQELHARLKELGEENSEFKMLVKLYEKNNNTENYKEENIEI